MTLFRFFRTINSKGIFCKIVMKNYMQKNKTCIILRVFFYLRDSTRLTLTRKTLFQVRSYSTQMAPHIRPHTIKTWTNSFDTTRVSSTWMQISQVVRKSIGQFFPLCSFGSTLNQTSQFSSCYAMHKWGNKHLLWELVLILWFPSHSLGIISWMKLEKFLIS